MSDLEKNYKKKSYIKNRKKLSGLFFETALPNEYLVQIGKKKVKPLLGAKKFKLFKKFLRVPANVQTLYFKTDNANMDYQGIGIEGYATWRIDPDRPEIAIRTLDFFDEEDPMARTNNELKTICVEAVRHVIANMTIDDALKKKDEIGDDLKTQLKTIADKWGIIFDQVGIESVRIMSSKLFENLQSQYRDDLRLEVEKKRISTDREISKEENVTREKTELEKIETDRKIEIVRVENSTKLKEMQLDENEKIEIKKMEILQKDYREKMKFNIERQQRKHELMELTHKLKIELQTVISKYLNTQNNIEDLKNKISKKELEIKQIEKELEQFYNSGELTNKLIENLPEIYRSIEIDNYSIIDSGKDGTITPISKIFSEILLLIKNNNLDLNIFKDKKTVSKNKNDKKD